MSSNQNSAIIANKIDTGSDRNIMLIHIVKILYPKEQLLATKIESIVLKGYNKIITPQLGIFEVTIYHKNKQKLCRFFKCMEMVKLY